MKKILKEQEVTATVAATETATQMIHLFKRAGTENYAIRYRPPANALLAFAGRKEIWKTTGTADKKTAEKIGLRLILELQDEADAYLTEFIPWVHQQMLTLSRPEADQLALQVSTGYAWEEFKRRQKEQADHIALQYAAMGLPAPAARPVITATESPPVKTRSPAKEATSQPNGITVEVIQAVFKLAAETRKAGTVTEKMRAREGRRLIDWMVANSIIELTPEDATIYTTSLRNDVAPKTAQNRFSLVSYAFSLALKSGHTVNIRLPFDPFANCGIVAAVGEGVATPREEISGEDFRVILASLPSVSLNAATHWAIKLSAVTGMRVGAIAGLRLNEVRKDGDIVCVQVKAREGNKTDIDYWIPVHNRVANEFYAWFQQQEGRPEDKLFKRASRSISNDFSTLLTQLKIKPEDGHQITFHSLRHSNTSWLNGLGIATAHANAMQGRKEGGSLGKYGSLAGVRTYAGQVINAPLWFDEDYLDQLENKNNNNL